VAPPFLHSTTEMVDTASPSPHLFLLLGDYTANAFEKMDMAPKRELAIANEESISLAATVPATPEEDPGSRASRSSSPGGSKRGRDDTSLQEENDLALVSRKLQRMFLSVEKKTRKLEIMIPDPHGEDEGTDFDWLCPESCVFTKEL